MQITFVSSIPLTLWQEIVPTCFVIGASGSPGIPGGGRRRSGSERNMRPFSVFSLSLRPVSMLTGHLYSLGTW
jgi:hypothetical protein